MSEGGEASNASNRKVRLRTKTQKTCTSISNHGKELRINRWLKINKDSSTYPSSRSELQRIKHPTQSRQATKTCYDKIQFSDIRKSSFDRRSCKLSMLSVTIPCAQNVHTQKHSDRRIIFNRCCSGRGRTRLKESTRESSPLRAKSNGSVYCSHTVPFRASITIGLFAKA